MPECLQGEATGHIISDAANMFLNDKAVAEQTSKALINQTMKMQGDGGSASVRAAKAILNIVS